MSCEVKKKMGRLNLCLKQAEPPISIRLKDATSRRLKEEISFIITEGALLFKL